MAPELRNSAKRVQNFLYTKGFPFNVKELPGSTRTAQEAADSIGCTVSQIAKSLVFREKETDLPILIFLGLLGISFTAWSCWLTKNSSLSRDLMKLLSASFFLAVFYFFVVNGCDYADN